jgi:hypothetical protein
LGINSAVELTYDYAAAKITAVYSHSNGNSLSYQFSYQGKNIANDKTTRYGEVCNEGSYKYDKNINPLRHLGYLDYMLFNFSANNKLEENVSYLHCSFPDLKPEKYEYNYHGDGYPEKVRITFDNGAASEEHYEYE